MLLATDTAARLTGQANPKDYQRLPPAESALLTPTPKPTFIDDYPHKVTFWVPYDPRCEPELLDRLRAHCRGEPRPRRCRYGPGWNLYIKRPDATALAILSLQIDWRVTGLEIARDFIFNEQFEADQMKLVVKRHLMKKHPGNHRQFTFGEVVYWGQPRPGRHSRFPACYSDPRSYLEPNTCHLEARHHGTPAVRSLGVFLDGFARNIYAPDLPKLILNLERFWDLHLSPNLKTLDLAGYGRYLSYCETGRRRRKIRPSDYDLGRHVACGQRLRSSWTMQNFIRARPDARRFVIPFELPRGYARAVMLRPPSYTRASRGG